MSRCLKIHTLVCGKYLEREESWSLCVDDRGDRKVVLEWFEIEPFSKAPAKEGRDCLPLESVLARGDELARKLRDVLSGGLAC